MIGIGVNITWLEDPHLKNFYDKFDFWTLTGALKYNRVSTEGYANADKILSVAGSVPVKGHLMISHNTVAENTGKTALRDYILTTISRYPTISEWDIAGEALTDVGTFRGYWERVKFTLEDLFIWAKEANPNNNYYYSEFNVKADFKWKSAVELVNALDINLAIQFHHHDYGSVWLRREWLSELKAKVTNKCAVSEVSIESFSELIQAKCYKAVLNLANENEIDACVWNLADIDKYKYLLSKNKVPKRAYFEVEKLLNPAKST